MPLALNHILDGVLQFLMFVAIIAGMVVIPTASLVTVLACSAGRIGIAALAFTSGWAQATLILLLGAAIEAVRGA